jgi:hypothetical protein
MAFTMITLDTGDGYRLADGSTPRARIVATPVVAMTNGTTTVARPVVLPLNSAGVATRTLQATTDPATLPTGNAYRFRVEVDGHLVRQFIAAVPHNTGSTVQLSALVELESVPELAAGITVTSTTIDDIVTLTQAAYNALTPNSRTLYVIVG